MASNLAGGVCIGQLNACILRIARLDADCSPTGGVNSGLVTAGLVTLTADPEIEEGTVFEPKNGCGTIAYTYEQEDVIKRYNLSGEFIFFDYEFMELAFGSTLILGKAGGLLAGKVIGAADRLYSAAPRNGVYLEVITTAVAQGAGSCVSAAGDVQVAVGHVFGKAKLQLGSSTFENAEKRMTFTGKSTNNPSLFDGPWNDYPGAGYSPNAAHFEVGYTQAQYDAILAQVDCGYASNLPAGS